MDLRELEKEQLRNNIPAFSPGDTVRVHVGSMRRKIEPDPSSPRYVVTEPWVGYRFVAEPVEGLDDTGL